MQSMSKMKRMKVNRKNNNKTKVRIMNRKMNKK